MHTLNKFSLFSSSLKHIKENNSKFSHYSNGCTKGRINTRNFENCLSYIAYFLYIYDVKCWGRNVKKYFISWNIKE
jgi:hypothetical protein